jgi:hypothetical protein
MTEEITVLALVYEGDPEEDVFAWLLVDVILGDSVLDLLKAFKAAMQSDSDYDGWRSVYTLTFTPLYELRTPYHSPVFV